MKIARFACVLCLVFGVKFAASQEATDVPAEPAYESIMEIRPETQYAAPEQTQDVAPVETQYAAPVQTQYAAPAETEYAAPIEVVAQAPKPATTLAAPIVHGNEPKPTYLAGPVTVAPTTIPATPEMWLYSEELRRHDDPAQAVRRKAELRGAQRMQRIAAMKWFGFSNSRPQASPIPMMGEYSPAWIGNGYNRYDWVGTNWPSTAVRIDNYNYDVRR